MGGAARAQEGKLAVCEQRQPQRAAPLPCSADSPPSHTLTLRSTACLPLPHRHLCIRGSGTLASLRLTHFSLSAQDQLMLTSSRQPSLI